MAFKDAMTDVASIFNISLSQNAHNQEIKSRTALYTNIPCRFHSSGNAGLLKQRIGTEEEYSQNWILQVEPKYGNGKRGGQVDHEGETYTITKVQKIRGDTPSVHHVVYHLSEQK